MSEVPRPSQDTRDRRSRRSARASSVRDCTPTVRKMRVRWASTVWTLMNSACAISRFVWPAAASSATRRSVSVSGDPAGRRLATRPSSVCVRSIQTVRTEPRERPPSHVSNAARDAPFWRDLRCTSPSVNQATRFAERHLQALVDQDRLFGGSDGRRVVAVGGKDERPSSDAPPRAPPAGPRRRARRSTGSSDAGERHPSVRGPGVLLPRARRSTPSAPA